MTDLIAAWLATATRPPREWPAADTPDYGPFDDEDDTDYTAHDGRDADWNHCRGPYYPKGL